MKSSKVNTFLDHQSREAMFAAIVESSEDAIISKTIEGFITSWNNSAERLFGYTEEEILNKNIRILIPDDRKDEEDMIIASILRGEKVTNFRTVRKARCGNEIDISLTVSPIYNKHGEIIGASKIVRDITEQVALERKLTEANFELQRSNMFKDEFFGLLGHELKTPLTSLKACLQLTKEMPEKKEEWIEKAELHTEKLIRMLNELLAVAKLLSGRLEIFPDKCMVSTFLNTAIEVVKVASPTHEIICSGNGIAALVSVDAGRMEEVMINLLTNAVKYSPGKDKIIVHTQIIDGYVEISVRDFALGIPEEDLDKIWTRFYRVPAHKNRVRGLGLGLHLCRNLVLLHKGSIWAESGDGEGSTFRVRLPLLMNKN